MRNRKLSICAITLLAAAVLGACGKSDSPATPTTPTASSSDVQPNVASAAKTADASSENTVVSDATLDITVDEYKKNFDRIMKQADTPYRANFRSKTHDGTTEVFAASLNDHLTIMLTVDRNSKKVTSLLLHGTGDGTTKSGTDIVVVAIAALASVFPDGKSEQVGPTVLRLMQEYQVGDNEPASHVVNGVRLAHMRNEQTGAFFSAEPV